MAALVVQSERIAQVFRLVPVEEKKGKEKEKPTKPTLQATENTLVLYNTIKTGSTDGIKFVLETESEWDVNPKENPLDAVIERWMDVHVQDIAEEWEPIITKFYKLGFKPSSGVVEKASKTFFKGDISHLFLCIPELQQGLFNENKCKTMADELKELLKLSMDTLDICQWMKKQDPKRVTHQVFQHLVSDGYSDRTLELHTLFKLNPNINLYQVDDDGLTLLGRHRIQLQYQSGPDCIQDNYWRICARHQRQYEKIEGKKEEVGKEKEKGQDNHHHDDHYCKSCEKKQQEKYGNKWIKTNPAVVSRLNFCLDYFLGKDKPGSTIEQMLITRMKSYQAHTKSKLNSTLGKALVPDIMDLVNGCLFFEETLKFDKTPVLFGLELLKELKENKENKDKVIIDIEKDVTLVSPNPDTLKLYEEFGVAKSDVIYDNGEIYRVSAAHIPTHWSLEGRKLEYNYKTKEWRDLGFTDRLKAWIPKELRELKALPPIASKDQVKEHEERKRDMQQDEEDEVQPERVGDLSYHLARPPS